MTRYYARRFVLVVAAPLVAGMALAILNLRGVLS